MRWVKDTFPPRERARWLLMTMRLSASSLAGTARTLVAVGTVSDTFMFLTTLAAAPRRGLCLPAATGAAGGLGAGFSGGFAGAFSAGALDAGAAAVVVAFGVTWRDGAGESSAGAGAGWTGAVAAPLGDAAGSSRSAPPTGLPGR